MARPRVRERLLDAAYALLRDGGASALTTRGVAAQAGTTEASVFNNFGDKAGLLSALIHERLPELLDAKDFVDKGCAADLRQWLEQVYWRAEQYYICCAPLTAGYWGTAGDASAGVAMDNLFPVEDALCQRLSRLQLDGQVASTVNIRAAVYVLLGAALHNALSIIARRRNVASAVAQGDQLDEDSQAMKKWLVDSVHKVLAVELAT